MFSYWVAAVLYLAHWVYYASAIKCATVERNVTEHCNGDYCVMRVGHSKGKEVKLARGCISGYPNLESGCYNEFLDLYTCFCNSSEHCNSSDLLKSSKNLTKHIECHKAYNVADGKLLDEKNTCTGETCYMDSFTEGGHTYGLVNCISYKQALRWFQGPYCTITADVVESRKGKLRRTCGCYSKMCNDPATFERSNKSSTVKCEAGFFPLNNSNSEFTVPATVCNGDFCYAKTKHLGVDGLETGCVEVMDDTKFGGDKYKSSHFEEVHFCHKDFCNQNHDKWFNQTHVE